MDPTIEENIRLARHRIDQASDRAGRDAKSITLIAVSKTVTAGRVAKAIEAGLRHLGENKVQEALDKAPVLSSYAEVSWHLIGHLQSNKVAKAVALFDLIHSVDSIKLLKNINDKAAERGKVQPVLIEINLGGESSKSGLAAEALPVLLEQAHHSSNLLVRGLMAIPPYREDPEQVRPFFAGLRELSRTTTRWQHGNVALTELSMGMSHDFEVAIEEGATMVRLGAAIFGERA